jgi:hypothetical protein
MFGKKSKDEELQKEQVCYCFYKAVAEGNDIIEDLIAHTFKIEDFHAAVKIMIVQQERSIDFSYKVQKDSKYFNKSLYNSLEYFSRFRPRAAFNSYYLQQILDRYFGVVGYTYKLYLEKSLGDIGVYIDIELE